MPVSQQVVQYAPPGKVATFAMQTAPAGWLACSGQAVSRTTYAALFAAIGIVHGAGDGATTFNLPDYRGEFLRGWDNGRGVDAGRAFASAQAHDIVGHSHGLTINAVGDHRHNSEENTTGVNQVDAFGTGANVAGYDVTGTGQTNPAIQTGNAGAHTHTGTISNTGGTETRPRNVAVLICIKT